MSIHHFAVTLPVRLPKTKNWWSQSRAGKPSSINRGLCVAGEVFDGAAHHTGTTLYLSGVACSSSIEYPTGMNRKLKIF